MTPPHVPEGPHKNGWPSWPELFNTLFNNVAEIKADVGGVKTGQKLTLDQMQSGFDRVHYRIDQLHKHGQAHIDRLQDRVTRLEARRGGGEPLSGLARLTSLLRMIAPLRELLAMLGMALLGIAALTQRAETKDILVGLAGWFGAGG